MSLDLARLAETKRRESGGLAADWLRALENARETLVARRTLSEEELERIALAAREPAKLTSIARLIYGEAKSRPAGVPLARLLFASVDASPFSLADWIDALDCFATWLLSRQRAADFPHMTMYLACCSDSPGAHEGQALLDLTQDMLATHGYDGRGA